MAAELISYKSIGIEPPVYKRESGLTPKEAGYVEYERIKDEVNQAVLDGRLPAPKDGFGWRRTLDGVVWTDLEAELAAFTAAVYERYQKAQAQG